MKKVLIVLGVTLILLLSGCSSNKTYHEITYSELNEMLDNKEDFILFIGSETCSACASYKVTLNTVIEDYDVDVKYIDLDKLSEQEYNEVIGKFPISGTPQTLFIENGEEEDTHNRVNGNAKYSRIVEKFQDNGYID